MLKATTIRGKLSLVLLVTVAALLLNGAAGFFLSRVMHSEVQHLYEEDVQPLEEVFKFYTAYSVQMVDAVQKYRDGIIDSTEAEGKIQQARTAAEEAWVLLAAHEFSEANQAVINRLKEQRQTADTAIDRAIRLIRAEDREGLDNASGSLYRSIDPMAQTSEALIQGKKEDALRSYEKSGTLFTTSSVGLAIFVTLILVFLGLFVRSISKSINRSVSALGKNLENIAAGDLETSALIQQKDELGKLSESVEEMRLQLQKQFATSAVYRAAVENASTNIMIADNDHNVIYMNGVIRGMFTRAEADIRKAMPFFSSEGIMGNSIHRYHKDPQRIKNILDNLRGNHFSTVEIGGRTFNQVFSPILDEKGNRLGIVVLSAFFET